MCANLLYVITVAKRFRRRDRETDKQTNYCRMTALRNIAR